MAPTKSSSLNVSMIVIGDEILSGRTSDLNGNWLAKFLFKTGLNFKAIRFIQDDQNEIFKALNSSFEESEIVITSGGIGPTLDDKTKNSLASYFNKKIIERDDVAEIVTKNYIQFGRTWTKEHNNYHFFPEDFTATNNPRGLAPGITYFDHTKNKLLLAGPGVPREFTQIVEQEFLPIIKHNFSNRFQENFQTVIRTKGVAEEKIFFELCPTLWQELENFGKVSSLPHTIGIDIIVSYYGNLDEHNLKLKKIRSIIELSQLATHVWQYGNKPINEMVLEYANENKFLFAFAESCTGGLVSSKITDLSGASSTFLGGVISYANSAKSHLLNVQDDTLNKFGAVSIETATEMAIGARDQFKADFAVSISGIAGPGGGTVQKPTGTVVIGYASKNINGARSFIFPGDRIRRKERFADMALLTLLELMQNRITQD
jgi:nicotinamide-nucleotide amidase